MASVFASSPALLLRKPVFSTSSSAQPYFTPLLSQSLHRGVAVKVAGSQTTPEPSLLRRPSVSAPSPLLEEEVVEAEEDVGVNWEDKILGETVPLVGFVRMLLHSGKYESGDRLNPEHQKIVLERLLPYHAEYENKIGCGIDHIIVGYHPEFESSRCLFIVRKDGETVDFSYWKCIKGLIRTKYPLYADTFIFRHFRRRRN